MVQKLNILLLGNKGDSSLPFKPLIPVIIFEATALLLRHSVLNADSSTNALEKCHSVLTLYLNSRKFD
jgi:hypothetical protein